MKNVEHVDLVRELEVLVFLNIFFCRQKHDYRIDARYEINGCRGEEQDSKVLEPFGLGLNFVTHSFEGCCLL